MNITRREALGLLLAAAATACGETKARPGARTGNQRTRRVLVLGAGISGIQAARELKAEGFQVTVLEARQRIGGRTFTDHSLGVPLDLGASWIHGVRRNPIYSLARELGVDLFDWDYEDGVVFDTHGRPIEMGDAYERLAWQLYRRAPRLVRRDPRTSVQDVVDAVAEDGLFDDLTEAQLDFLVNTSVEHDVAADAEHISAAGMLEGGGFGGRDVVLPRGYETLVRPLAQGLDIRTGQKVVRVSFDATGVQVETGGESLQADHAVITVPLGVLKAGGISFEPALPVAKQRAIEAMEMGVLNKTYLRFPQVFWDRDALNFSRVSEEEDAWTYWVNVASFSGEPILGGLNSASFGAELEALDDETIVAEAIAALRSMFGNKIPQPVGWRITRWKRDPFAFGSYSFIPTSAHHDMRSDLARPVADRLFFAGEATHEKYPSTVHGAYLSGQRVAREVMAAERVGA